MNLPIEIPAGVRRSIAAFLTFFEHNPPGVRLGSVCIVGHDKSDSVVAKDECGMQVASELMSLQKPWHSLFALGVMAVLIGGPVFAQDLDRGKSAATLFADGCAACHRSARGLAKDRFSFTLFLFLQKHYASNASSAWTLTSYLESVDSTQRGRSRAAAAKPSPAAITSRSSLRPPMPVPGR